MLETLNGVGAGGAHLNTKLPKILAELQGLTISGPLTGAAANTNIAVPEGIDLQDTILKAIQFAAGVPSDITSTMSITDMRPSGTITMGAGLVAGDKVAINGKTYTAVAGVPTPTSPVTGTPYTFVDGVAIAALATTPMKVAALQAMGFSASVAATLAAGGALYIAAASLAQAINSQDPFIESATAAAAVVTIYADAESTAGNSITLDVSLSNTHMTRSGATLSGGLFGQANGTVTLAAAAAADTVTVAGQVYTAVAPGTVLAPNQFIGGTVTPADLTNLGFSAVVAQALITAGNDKAAAVILAHQINSNDGARVIANPGLPVGTTYLPLTNITVAQAAAVSAVVSLTSVTDGPAGAAYTLVSSNGTRLAVTGSGTLTAPSRGVKSTNNTTGNTIVLFWFKKTRVVGAF